MRTACQAVPATLSGSSLMNCQHYAILFQSMDADHRLAALQRIKKTQNNISTYSAIFMGSLMVIYFFTFAMLIDRGHGLALMAEIITTIVFIYAFFFLNKLAFHATRLWYLGRRPYQEILSCLTSADMSLQGEELLKRLQQSGQNRLQT